MYNERPAKSQGHSGCYRTSRCSGLVTKKWRRMYLYSIHEQYYFNTSMTTISWSRYFDRCEESMSWAARSFRNYRGRFWNRDRFGPLEPSVDLDQHRGQRPFGSGETLYLRLEPDAFDGQLNGWDQIGIRWYGSNKNGYFILFKIWDRLWSYHLRSRIGWTWGCSIPRGRTGGFRLKRLKCRSWTTLDIFFGSISKAFRLLDEGAEIAMHPRLLPARSDNSGFFHKSQAVQSGVPKNDKLRTFGTLCGCERPSCGSKAQCSWSFIVKGCWMGHQGCLRWPQLFMSRSLETRQGKHQYHGHTAATS